MERYAITVTFKPHLKYVSRMKLINTKFRQIVRDCLKLHCTYKLLYAIEYHKYPVNHPFHGQPNPMAPHVHAYLEIEGELQQRQINEMYREFSSRFGRSQFDQLHTVEDAERWVNYCVKDVQVNNANYPTIKHYKEVSHDLHLYSQQLEMADPQNPYFSDSSDS